jgi:hypothetical protein
VTYDPSTQTVTGPYGRQASTSITTSGLAIGPGGSSVQGGITYDGSKGNSLTLSRSGSLSYDQDTNQYTFSGGGSSAEINSASGGSIYVYYDPGTNGYVTFTSPRNNSVTIQGGGTYDWGSGDWVNQRHATGGSTNQENISALIEGGATPEKVVVDINGKLPRVSTFAYNDGGYYLVPYSNTLNYHPNEWVPYGDNQLEKTVSRFDSPVSHRIIISPPRFTNSGYFTAPTETSPGYYTPPSGLTSPFNISVYGPANHSLQIPFYYEPGTGVSMGDPNW